MIKSGDYGSSKFVQNGDTSRSVNLPLRLIFSIHLGLEQTAPPIGHPRIVSQLLTLEYESKICRQVSPSPFVLRLVFHTFCQAYLPGKHFTVPALPNITAVNALGDFDIEADRLAIIDGEGDNFTCTVRYDLTPPS